MTCTCIVWHPQTKEDRETQVSNLEYARKVGDPLLTAIYLASLAGPCLAEEEE